MEYCTDRESYSLASGLALGMVCLGVSASFSFQLQLVEESLYIGAGVMRIVSSLTCNCLWLNGFFTSYRKALAYYFFSSSFLSMAVI